MKLAILQPVFIPDLYDLATMLSVDTIVYQDSEQWSRKGRTHRALIRTPIGTDYLNIPVMTADRKQPIHKVRIDHGVNWIEQALKSLTYNYRNSVYYDFYEPEIRADLQMGHQFKHLLDFTLFFRNRLFQFLELEMTSKVIFSSHLDVYSSNPDQLAENLNADIYYQEHDAKHYQRQGEKKSTLNFTHPVYRQHFDEFEPYCCLLDLLFQYGPESFRITDHLQASGGP